MQQWYQNKPDFNTADPVSVTAGQTHSGIDAALQLGGQITGHVTAASDGHPLQNVCVNANDASLQNPFNQPPAGFARTDANGDYTISGVPVGSYKVVFQDDAQCGGSGSYVQQWYQNKPDFNTADPVLVTAGQTHSGINAALVQGNPTPSASTGQASAISTSGATLNGTVNPNGVQVSDCHFDYGTSSSYGSTVPCASSPESGTSGVTVSANVLGLSPGTIYHFRLVARNANGTSEGSDATFTTTTPPSGGTGGGTGGGSGGTTGTGGTGGTTSTGTGGTSAVSGASTTTVSTGQVKAALLAQLIPTGKAAKIGVLLKNAGYTLAFKTLGSGRIVINWYYLPNGAKLSKAKAKPKPKPLLIASGVANFSKKDVVKIKIKLTAKGKQMLKSGKALKLTSKGTYTPTGGAAVAATKTFTVKR